MMPHWTINGPAQGFHALHRHIGKYIKNYSCLKLQGLEIWYVALSSRPLLSLSNYAPWAKCSPTLGSHVLHRLLLGKYENIFLSETTRYGIKSLYLECSIILCTFTKFVKIIPLENAVLSNSLVHVIDMTASW